MRDLTNKRFGRLVVLSVAGKNKWRNIIWECRCDCGNKHFVVSGKLIQGNTKSCGCYRRETSTKSLEKHGITTGGKPRTFIIWNGMKARCFNEKSISYKSYGARGITVCQDWLDFKTFHEWAVLNGHKDGYQLDRIDNDGDYTPRNCRFIPEALNRKNQRKQRLITIFDETENITDWCKKLKISKATAYRYLNESEEAFKIFCVEKMKNLSEGAVQ